MVNLAEKRPLTLALSEPGQYRGSFEAMACRCELLIRTGDESVARRVLGVAAREALRIEHKFSRYRGDGICQALNHSNGQAVAIDPETRQLLTLADTAWRLSDGLFDITSGVLGRIWRFDGADRLPSPAQIAALLPHIGWDRVQLQPGRVILPPGMALDFGGLGKEYAVDRALALLQHHFPGVEVLVNFGGDLAASPTPTPWRVGISAVDDDAPADTLALCGGAVATSGDSERYLMQGRRRLSHILNPKSGYPVADAPASVTVQAQRCTDAGLIATLAMLQGERAEAFLEAQGLPYRVQRRPA
ncbi:FAD:protein FMN transferase [Ferrimonas sediminicola]|uniref:FAD:protein FMN transferase n=1 Tax=Ferrimonas sediminicola TaxID=2569538 RepID=A0A4U1BCX6_9GAMM|nr:FAD:protein FMN transferase [Ferrimonas sediminicola]TKB48852.1 FAD:protein FMN transferase [Ferrimonas sediminicola]